MRDRAVTGAPAPPEPGGRRTRVETMHTRPVAAPVPRSPSPVPSLPPVPEPALSSKTHRSDPPDASPRIGLALHGLATLAVPGAVPVRLERKQAALLAYVHHAGPTSRGRLATLLWPAATASGARGNLRQCLARLRRIAPGVIVEVADTVALAPTVQVELPGDGAADLLGGHDYADCDDFARWLQARVDGERADRQARLTAALRAAADRGDFAEAQARADALLALDAEAEDPYRALMEVAFLRGDFAAAVRAWDRCREMLRQLYGVAPSSATQALGAAILAAAPPAPRPAPQAAEPAHGNLGASPPVLYGRSDALAALRSALRSHRLVTVIGIGGVGKTSLALAAAHASRGEWPDGAWFVDLAPVVEAGHVAVATAQALGVSLAGLRPPQEELAMALGASEMLVVIDNAEQVCDAVAELAAALLDGTTQLRLLVTSRQALRLPQEQRFPLAGLSVQAEPDRPDLHDAGALALFEARAAALDPRFRLTAANAPAVADVCRRLDGLPLAIELAAARVPVLGIEALRTRLLHSLGVLGAKATTSAPRHQTLRATFDWTHALLSPGEQQLLRRLSVFVGGFDLELAEDVVAGCDGDAAGLIDALSALIDRSLVVVGDGDPPRHRLLEVTRAYALEKLAGSGEHDRVSKAHAHAVWHRFARAEIDLNETVRGALSRGRFLQLLAPELDNLRAARVWARSAPDGRVLSVGLAGASAEALRLLGRATEALLTMLEVREAVDDGVPAAASELFWTGLCALGTHGRMSRAEILVVIAHAERLYRQSGSARRVHVGLYRTGFAFVHLGDVASAHRAVAGMASLEGADWPARALVQRLTLQGAVDAVRGDFDAAVEAYRSAAALLAPEPDEDDVVLNVRSNLSMVLLGAERPEEALAEALDVLSRQPSPVVRNITLRAALVAHTFLGRVDDARALARQAMPAWLADDMLPHMLSVFAWLAWLQGRTADALRLDGAARTQVDRTGLSNSPVFARARALLERAVEGTGVPIADAARWRGEGERLDDESVAALCLGDAPVRRVRNAPPPVPGLAR